MANTNVEKVTKRDRYEQAIKVFEEAAIEATLRDELIAFANHEIELLDNKAAKAKESAEKNKASTDELAKVVKAALTDQFQTINELVVKINDAEATAGKIQFRLRTLVDSGEVEKQEISVPSSGNGKTRKLMAFRLIAEA